MAQPFARPDRQALQRGWSDENDSRREPAQGAIHTTADRRPRGAQISRAPVRPLIADGRSDVPLLYGDADPKGRDSHQFWVLGAARVDGDEPDGYEFGRGGRDEFVGGRGGKLGSARRRFTGLGQSDKSDQDMDARSSEPLIYPYDPHHQALIAFQGPSQVGYWSWLNPILIIVAYMPAIVVGCIGAWLMGFQGFCLGFGSISLAGFAAICKGIFR